MSHEFKMPNPGIGFTWIINLLISILSTLIPLITPILKVELEAFLLGWYAKAKETPNPWDDFLAKFFLRIFGIPIPGE
jgi:hypothetical protein